MRTSSSSEIERVSLCEVLDRVLNKGAVINGEVTISVADIDLIYLGLGVVLASVETIQDAPLVERTRFIREKMQNGIYPVLTRTE